MKTTPSASSILVDDPDVRMLESRGGLRLGYESLPPFGVHTELGGKHLQGDFAPQLLVPGAVDDLHLTAVKLFEDGEMRQTLADHALMRPARRGNPADVVDHLTIYVQTRDNVSLFPLRDSRPVSRTGCGVRGSASPAV